MYIIMARTSVVSVRDLKQNVREIVSRAARGEQIVVTRYGTPRAMVCPVGSGITPRAASQPTTGPTAPDDEFEREQRTFDRMLASGRLEAHRGRYVAVARGRVIDVDADAATLVRRVGRRLGKRTFFVGFAGVEEPLLDLPGQELH